MDAEFWHRKWRLNEIGFHDRAVNSLLVTHFAALSLPQGRRVFLPLCGKILDIHWLLSQGYRVSGAELSELAVAQLFTQLAMVPEIVVTGRSTRYSAANIDIFVGDVFDLSRAELGAVDAIYDRAALIALPELTRERYACHLMEITGRAPQLLVTLDYEQNLVGGPPFSVTGAEISNLYGRYYDMKHLTGASVEGGLKGKVAAVENVWLLTKF